MDWINILKDNMHHVVQLMIMLMEFIGMIVLVVSAIRCFIRWLRRDSSIRIELAKGIALALEFKLGGEVLRTVIVRDWSELGILGAIIVLRSLITFLLHWEIKTEEKSMNESESSAAHHLSFLRKQKKPSLEESEASR